jgi:cytochrome b561
MAASSPPSSQRYDRGAVLLHWIIGVWLLGQIAFGWCLDEFERGSPAKAWAVNMHKSSGLILGLLIILRIIWRRRHPPPPYPGNLTERQVRAIRGGHLSMYLCMVAMPLTGYLASNFSSHGIKFMNQVLLPPWGPDDKAIYGIFNGAHDILGTVFTLLVIGHILFALYHAFIAKDGLSSRMSL